MASLALIGTTIALGSAAALGSAYLGDKLESQPTVNEYENVPSYNNTSETPEVVQYDIEQAKEAESNALEIANEPEPVSKPPALEEVVPEPVSEPEVSEPSVSEPEPSAPQAGGGFTTPDWTPYTQSVTGEMVSKTAPLVPGSTQEKKARQEMNDTYKKLTNSSVEILQLNEKISKTLGLLQSKRVVYAPKKAQYDAKLNAQKYYKQQLDNLLKPKQEKVENNLLQELKDWIATNDSANEFTEGTNLNNWLDAVYNAHKDDKNFPNKLKSSIRDLNKWKQQYFQSQSKSTTKSDNTITGQQQVAEVIKRNSGETIDEWKKRAQKVILNGEVEVDPKVWPRDDEITKITGGAEDYDIFINTKQETPTKEQIDKNQGQPLKFSLKMIAERDANTKTLIDRLTDFKNEHRGNFDESDKLNSSRYLGKIERILDSFAPFIATLNNKFVFTDYNDKTIPYKLNLFDLVGTQKNILNKIQDIYNNHYINIKKTGKSFVDTAAERPVYEDLKFKSYDEYVNFIDEFVNEVIDVLNGIKDSDLNIKFVLDDKYPLRNLKLDKYTDSSTSTSASPRNPSTSTSASPRKPSTSASPSGLPKTPIEKWWDRIGKEQISISIETRMNTLLSNIQTSEQAILTLKSEVEDLETQMNEINTRLTELRKNREEKVKEVKSLDEQYKKLFDLITPLGAPKFSLFEKKEKELKVSDAEMNKRLEKVYKAERELVKAKEAYNRKYTADFASRYREAVEAYDIEAQNSILKELDATPQGIALKNAKDAVEKAKREYNAGPEITPEEKIKESEAFNDFQSLVKLLKDNAITLGVAPLSDPTFLKVMDMVYQVATPSRETLAQQLPKIKEYNNFFKTTPPWSYRDVFVEQGFFALKTLALSSTEADVKAKAEQLKGKIEDKIKTALSNLETFQEGIQLGDQAIMNTSVSDIARLSGRWEFQQRIVNFGKSIVPPPLKSSNLDIINKLIKNFKERIQDKLIGKIIDKTTGKRDEGVTTGVVKEVQSALNVITNYNNSLQKERTYIKQLYDKIKSLYTQKNTRDIVKETYEKFIDKENIYFRFVIQVGNIQDLIKRIDLIISKTPTLSSTDIDKLNNYKSELEKTIPVIESWNKDIYNKAQEIEKLRPFFDRDYTKISNIDKYKTQVISEITKYKDNLITQVKTLKDEDIEGTKENLTESIQSVYEKSINLIQNSVNFDEITNIKNIFLAIKLVEEHTEPPTEPPAEEEFAPPAETTPIESPEIGEYNTIDDIEKDIQSKYTNLSNNDTLEKDDYRIRLNNDDFESVKTSSNKFDCLIHAFLIDISASFRKLSDKQRNQYADFFRRTVLPTKYSEEEKNTDEFKLINTERFLTDQHITKLATTFNINIILFEKTGDGVIANHVCCEKFTDKEFIVIYNPGDLHFRGVKKHDGTYMLSNSDGETLNKKYSIVETESASQAKTIPAEKEAGEETEPSLDDVKTETIQQIQAMTAEKLGKTRSTENSKKLIEQTRDDAIKRVESSNKIDSVMQIGSNFIKFLESIPEIPTAGHRTRRQAPPFVHLWRRSKPSRFKTQRQY